MWTWTKKLLVLWVLNKFCNDWQIVNFDSRECGKSHSFPQWILIRKVPHSILFLRWSKLCFNCRICDLDMDEEEVVWMKPDTSQCSIVSWDSKTKWNKMINHCGFRITRTKFSISNRKWRLQTRLELPYHLLRTTVWPCYNPRHRWQQLQNC